MNNVKSAAYGYGTEKRILLLHGPVGSSKSTIARILKKGIEVYSNQKESHRRPRSQASPAAAG